MGGTAVCEDFSDGHLQIMPRQNGYPLNTRLRASLATARQARNDAKEQEISGTTPAFAKASAFAEAMARQVGVAGKVVPPISRNWRVSRAQSSDHLPSPRAFGVTPFGCGGAALGDRRGWTADLRLRTLTFGQATISCERCALE